MNDFLETLKNFGIIYYKSYQLKKCPINTKEEAKFIITGEEENIITKIGQDGWTGTLCKYELNKSVEEHIWTVKILKTTKDFGNIFIGVTNNDFDFNSSHDINFNKGWYYYCLNGNLYSGPPHNYIEKNSYLESKNKEVTVVMNMKKGTLKFIIDKKDKGISYVNIPLDKPIYPSIIFSYIGDSLEIS